VGAICVLEPDADVRQLIVRILEEAGWDVTTDAASAEAVVVDPAYAELFEQVRALKQQRPQLHVVCLSIAPPEPHVLHALEPDAYLHKPFQRAQLIAALGAVAQSRSRRD
jgi:DNA-binding response OmpR family regulator